MLLIVTGAMLIALLIAIAAFSLGVYVGTHGWTSDPPPLIGPGQKPLVPVDQGRQPAAGKVPPSTARAAGQPQQPAARPQLVGRVRSVSQTTVTLETPEGPRLVQLAEDVQVFRRSQGDPGEAPASLAKVVPGDHLAVYGFFQGNGSRLLIARRLVLLPPPANRQP
jgi:hypothetical protein